MKNTNSTSPIISILILVYNAPRYVKETLETLKNVTAQEDQDKFETIVVNNNSAFETKNLLDSLKQEGYIDKLFHLNENLLFAKGNNFAAKHTQNSKYYLLLNSDVSIRNKDWLSKLVELKEQGHYAVASYGFCNNPKRSDGYCFLVDKEIYDKYELDPDFEWFFSLTKLQAEILQNEGNILSIGGHNDYLYHYGGRSGNVDIIKKAKGMSTPRKEIKDWFINAKYKVEITQLNYRQYLLEVINYYLNKIKFKLKAGRKKVKSLFRKKNL